MPLTDAPGKARALYEARRTGVQIEPFTDADPDLGMADGYAVQQELVKLLLAEGDRIVGYKVGLTSKPMQKMIGVDQPDYGPVLGSTVYADGDAVPVSAFIQPRIEAEIAFVLGSGLAGPGVSVLDARRAIAGMVAAVEIVDSRFADWRIKLADTVADLASNRAVAVSRAYGPAAGLELVDALREDDVLRGYHLLPSVRGDLLERLGRAAEASEAFARAAELTSNARERTLFLSRAHRP